MACDIVQASSQGRQMSDAQEATIRKVLWRLLPFLGLCFFVNWLDRSNVSFAALTMNKDLQLSATTFGAGAGVFFWGFLLFEVPSNIMLARVGARLWIARIMLTWGVLAMAFAFVTGSTSFIVLRFLLGVAEAGFVPGATYYLSRWLPQSHLGRAVGIYGSFSALAPILGAPLSGYLLGFDGLLGLHGWQWLFLIEGLPAILAGLWCLLVLTERPSEATWLAEDQRRWLGNEIDRQGAAGPVDSHVGVLKALGDGRVLLLALCYFAFVFSLYGVLFWQPLIIQEFGVSNVQVGLLSALPALFGGASMILVLRHSDKVKERRLHVLVPAIAGCAGLLLAASQLGHPVWAMVGLCLASAGIYPTLVVLQLYPLALFKGPAAAAALALVTAIGNSGGYFGTQLVGVLKDVTGAYWPALVAFAASSLVGGLVLCAVDARCFSAVRR